MRIYLIFTKSLHLVFCISSLGPPILHLRIAHIYKTRIFFHVQRKQKKSKMGKFNKLSKKNRALQLEIVPKDQENEVQLKEVRKSDDVIPKKVKF